MRERTLRTFLLICLLVISCGIVIFPQTLTVPYTLFGKSGEIVFQRPSFSIFGRAFPSQDGLRQGLDIQGGTQITLRAEMGNIPQEDRETAFESAKEVIVRRVDLFGVSEPVVQTSKRSGEYRIVVELAGVDDPAQAIALIGTTAQLDFRLQGVQGSEATQSAMAFLSSFKETGLTGADLQRASVVFDPQTNAPTISLRFNPEGTKKFAEITKANVNGVLGIFLDGYPLMLPRINQAIIDGQAVISGEFSLDEAKNLSIQLNAGALPVPIEVIQQRTIGASLGQETVRKSIQAGVIGIGCVMIFMVAVYGWRGVLADMALLVYALLTVTVYQLMHVTITLPGIAGMLLSIGMAVDANILIFERMKEELRAGKPFETAMKLGFGRAWDSIKDANLTTIFASLVLINPLNLSFLNTSGMVRGFGVTVLIGVLLSLFTGIVVSRTLMQLFLKEYGYTKDSTV